MAGRGMAPLQVGNGGAGKLGDPSRDWYVVNYFPAVTRCCSSSIGITDLLFWIAVGSYCTHSLVNILYLRNISAPKLQKQPLISQKMYSGTYVFARYAFGCGLWADITSFQEIRFSAESDQLTGSRNLRSTSKLLPWCSGEIEIRQIMESYQVTVSWAVIRKCPMVWSPLHWQQHTANCSHDWHT